MTTRKSLSNDNEKKSKLKMELAIIVDYGEIFVKATYNLEGDGPLIVPCFEIIDSLCIAIKILDSHFPKLRLLLMICPKDL